VRSALLCSFLCVPADPFAALSARALSSALIRLMTSTHCCLNASCRRLLCLYSAVRPDVSSADNDAPSSDGRTTGVGVGVGAAVAADAPAAGGTDEDGAAAAGKAAAPVCEDAAPPTGCCTPLGGSMAAVVAAAATDPVAAWGRAERARGNNPRRGGTEASPSHCARSNVSERVYRSSVCPSVPPVLPALPLAFAFLPLGRTAETVCTHFGQRTQLRHLSPPVLQGRRTRRCEQAHTHRRQPKRSSTACSVCAFTGRWR
jgi:hypothetical protein